MTDKNIPTSNIMALYQQIPKGEITSLLKEAACRFFIPPSRMKLITKYFIHQQGLHQLLKQPQILTRLLDDQRSISELLISDAEADKSAASLDVKVGCSLDPKPLYGTAHFLEHMLFMGTEKYPIENEYSQFMQNNGGMNNNKTKKEESDYMMKM